MDTVDLRAECPECGTSYTYQRLGLAGAPVGRSSTVRCQICGTAFDSVVEVVETVVVTPPTIIERVWERTITVTRTFTAAPIWRLWNRTPTLTITTNTEAASVPMESVREQAAPVVTTVTATRSTRRRH